MKTSPIPSRCAAALLLASGFLASCDSTQNQMRANAYHANDYDPFAKGDSTQTSVQNGVSDRSNRWYQSSNTDNAPKGDTTATGASGGRASSSNDMTPRGDTTATTDPNRNPSNRSNDANSSYNGKAYDRNGARANDSNRSDMNDRDSRWNNNSKNNQAALAADSADARILSFLHEKNQEEIAVGKLAQEKGQSDAVRKYGATLVRDHTDNDSRVMTISQTQNIPLNTQDADWAKKNKDGRNMDRADERKSDRNDPDWAKKSDNMQSNSDNKQNSSDTTRTYATNNPKSDPCAELRKLSGSDFDNAVAMKMHDGHAKVIERVQNAQSNVTNPQVKKLLDDTLPVLRKHEELAANLHTDSSNDDMSK